MVDQRVTKGHNLAERLYQKIAPAILFLVLLGAFMDRSFDGILTIVVVGIALGLGTYGFGFLIGYLDDEDAPRSQSFEIDRPDPYAVAGNELLNEKLDVGTWARAVADGGTENDIKARYINLRVASLKADAAPQRPSAVDNTLGFRLGRQIAMWLRD